MRELRVGLLMLGGLGGLALLFFLSSAGPGFLGPRRLIDVTFRNGQGIRAGCPVRVAGIDAGRVAAVELYEGDDGLRVKLSISLPGEIADRLRQDVQIAVQPGLTGQSTVNIVSSGRSDVALVTGQVVQGIESSMFDPILEQVGLGAGERDHLRRIIAQVRATVDAAVPQLQELMTSLNESAAEVRQTVAAVRPRIESTAAEVEQLARSVDATRVNEVLVRVQNLATQADALLSETRPIISTAIQNVGLLAQETTDLTRKNRPQIEVLIAGLNASRTRLDAVLANTQEITEKSASLLTANRPDIERTVANVRDATGYGLKLVQKLYGNPFYLSPFYKPKPEDIRAQEVYDSANSFLLAAKEFHDALKELQAMQGKAKTKGELDAYNRLFARAWDLVGQMKSTQDEMANGLQDTVPATRR
jgi:phospholipid/cholesterol/gamma-HCH transport system substrate-binding protein